MYPTQGLNRAPSNLTLWLSSFILCWIGTVLSVISLMQPRFGPELSDTVEAAVCFGSVTSLIVGFIGTIVPRPVAWKVILTGSCLATTLAAWWANELGRAWGVI